MIKIIITSIILTLLSPFTMAMEIKHMAPREGSVLDQYSLDLLKFLLEKSGQKVTYKTFTKFGAQSRREIQLKSGEYDIDWLGSTSDLEARIAPIRFPILRGLLGHRVFITNKVTSEKLNKSMSFDELKQFKVVQGTGWGDVEILQGGGFQKMQTHANFETLFKIVDSNRANLFPRSIIEPYGELASRCNLGSDYACTDSNLMVDDKLLVVYQLPMFFFVSPKRQDLQKALNDAFTNHYEDFVEYFNNYPLVKDSLEKLKGRTVFRIEENKAMSEKTKNLDAKYWLNL